MDKKIKELIAKYKLSDVQIYEILKQSAESETPVDSDAVEEQDEPAEDAEAKESESASPSEAQPVKLEDLKKMMADLIEEKLKVAKPTLPPKKAEPQAKQTKLPKDYKPGEFVLLA